MTDVKIVADVQIGQFVMPNFVSMTVMGCESKQSVGHLSDEQASAYWDEMKYVWLAHVKKIRERMDD